MSFQDNKIFEKHKESGLLSPKTGPMHLIEEENIPETKLFFKETEKCQNEDTQDAISVIEHDNSFCNDK